MIPQSHGHSHAAARSSDAGGGQQFNLHTVLVAIRCWWKIAAPVGVLLAVVAGFAVYYFVKPKYTAAAWLLISEKREFIFRPLPAIDPKKFVQNLVELLRSPPVVEPVASKPAVASTPELAREPDPAQALRKKIKIRAVGQSDFYVIEFTSTSPEKAALVANEMSQKFRDLQSIEDARKTERMLVLLKKRLDDQAETVKSLRKTVETLTKQVTGRTFGVKGANDALPEKNPLAELQSKLNAADIEHAILKAQVQAESELLEKRAIEVPSSVVDEYVEADQHVAGLRGRLAQDRAKLKEHERTSTNLSGNAAYKQLLKRIADDELSLEKSRAELQISIKEDLESQARKSREGQLAAMREKVATSELTMQILQEKYKTELKSLKDLHGDALQLEFHRADYDRASTVYNAIADRILHIEMEQKLPTSVELISEATPPAFPDEAMPYKKILMASLAALFFPFGVAIGVEYLYRRVSSREQVEAAGRIAVVGEITTLPSRGASRRGRSRKNNRELQLFEESIDGLRTYLSLVDSLQGVKILAVASAVSREGKTSLAAQLVVSLASATGERTLLIDGDMRSPDIHRIFDIERGPGLAEVLGGTCAVEDAIHTEFSESIHLLAAGTLTTSPHRLLGNGAFNKLLDRLRTTYTYIVIDTPPILPASEALVMARAADTTVLCVRRDFSRVRQVMEAYSRLQTAGVRAAGAVLSGIPTSSYTYRYGSYYYDRHSDEAGTSELVEG